MALLRDVAQPRQLDAEPPWAEPIQEGSDSLRTPIATTEIPSALRSRSRRFASAASASWSLVPSTSTTVRARDIS